MRSSALIVILTLLCSTAQAKASGMKAAFAPNRVSLDGMPNEFDGEWRRLTLPVKGGEPGEGDLAARVLVAYDDDALWVAADVVDDKLVGGGDRVELVLGIPGGKVFAVEMFPGVPGKSRAMVKHRGRRVSGAKIVEAPTDAGYSLEAKIPWRAIPNSETVRIGYRGGLFVHDADASRRVEHVLGSTAGRSYERLPPLSKASEIALGSWLLRERNITRPPVKNLLANVVGDKMKERVLIYDRYLVILGPGYRNGEQYYFRDLGSRADKGDLLRFEVEDFTGDGLQDVLLRKRVRGRRGTVEVLEVLSYHPGGETLTAVFSQEVLLEVSGGTIANDVRLSGRGSRTKIVLKPGKSNGIDARRFNRVSNTGASPVLVPWGTVASQTFQVNNGSFVVSDEQSQQPAALPQPRPTATPRPQPSNTSTPTDSATVWEKRPSADIASVYAHYKKQRRVSGAPRFTLNADVAEDARPERLVVHNRDLVVFGSGFHGGRGFAAVELSHFERSRDVTKVTTRDITRDGKHEILVWGVIRSPLPEDLGSGHMKREVIVVYKVKGGHFERVFAAELARRIGKKRVAAKIRFRASGIELRPGKARGYDEGSYPWLQKTTPNGGFEPLLLPWGGIDRVRLRYDGNKFIR